MAQPEDRRADNQGSERDDMRSRPLLMHVTTSDISLSLLLGPQLAAFTAAGYEVVGVSAPGEHVVDLTAAGIRHLSLRHATRSDALHRDLMALAELLSLFRRLRPDIVHTHNPKPGVYGRLAARAARVPVVVNTVHGLYALPQDRMSKRAVVYGLERMAATCSHAELVQNIEDLDVLRGIGIADAKLHLLGNGIDLQRFDPSRVDPRRVAEIRQEAGAGANDVLCGAVGRLVLEKGYRELFAAIDSLRMSAPQARFVIVGPADPSKRDAIPTTELDQAQRSGVRFLGLRHDVVELYAAMDLYILASHREGFPRSAMEASAMGVPVVATDIRGCRQVVEDGVTGLLVPPRRTSPLTEAILTLIDDPERRKRMADAGRSKASKEFDQRYVIETTLQVYESLLAHCESRYDRSH